MTKSIRSKSRRKARALIRGKLVKRHHERIERITSLDTEKLREQVHFLERKQVDRVTEPYSKKLGEKNESNAESMDVDCSAKNAPMMENGKLPVWLSKKQRRTCVQQYRRGKANARRSTKRKRR
ncbi:hypothetical protein Ciccas_009163 [Cichlidogyrus casuarinus]|uniref:Uncharacterized protein n=1 Tax=Cichlidogyrus casuarinus TaxID=1844966 RepID=A0ABD2PYJ2_9PLAT